jgi:glycosyltransferase involved in cell wall biosynthesis
MNKISVIIPTYKEPEALDLCLRSAITGQTNKNQIIVVVDGFYDINKAILDKYKNNIDVLNLEDNVGMIRAMNYGHCNASNDLVFHVQDDNVFPNGWDDKLQGHYEPNSVLTANQIEPNSSMFKQFYIKNLGTDPSVFNLDEFLKSERAIRLEYILKKQHIKDECGSTFPFLIHKNDYLRIGGFDENYPGPWVVDWEFFMKCKMAGMKMLRTYNCHFYHFVSLGTRTPDKIKSNQETENACFEYFKYKWGRLPKHDSNTNEKSLQ